MASNNNSGGIGFVELLQVMFIGLKLGKVIDWSWWWVMAPTIGSTGIVVVTLLVCLLALIIKVIRN